MTQKPEVIKYVTVEQAGALLAKSPQAVRQLIARNKIASKKEHGRVGVLLSDVLSYYARKRQLPSWEENVERLQKENKAFVAGPTAAGALLIQPGYLNKLVQKKLIEGYVTSSGQLMVEKNSINSYLRTPDSDTDTL